jgi:hypothetical protein
MPIERDQKGDRLSHRFFRGIAEEKMSATVPARDDAVQVFWKYGVDRGLDNGGVMLGGALPA